MKIRRMATIIILSISLICVLACGGGACTNQPTTISDATAEKLTGYLEEISHSWHEPSIKSANKILNNEALDPEDWEPFFRGYFSQHAFTEYLRWYLSSAVAWNFRDAVRADLQQGLYGPITDIILIQTDAYLESDRSSLTKYSPIAQSIMNSHRFLNHIIQNQAPGVEYRDDIFEFCIALTREKPVVYGTAPLYADEYPFAGAFRAQAHINLVEALELTDSVSNQIIDTLELTGIKRDIFYNYGVLVIDNQGLDTGQLGVIKSMLNLVPRAMYNLTNITVKDFFGNTDYEFLSLSMKAGVNIFGIKVGARRENGFPADVSPLYSDVFSLVVAHELNHIVNAHYIEKNDLLRNRQETLVEQAGEDRMNYLRSMIEGGFFQEAPQEFFASISNQYFASSEHTLRLGIERFNQGRPEPLNQFLFFADVYSLGGDFTLFYTLSTYGYLAREEVPIVRDDNGHITGLDVGTEQYRFELDENGNVVSVNPPGG